MNGFDMCALPLGMTNSAELRICLGTRAHLLDGRVALLFGQDEARQHTVIRRVLHPCAPHRLPADASLPINSTSWESAGMASQQVKAAIVGSTHHAPCAASMRADME